MGAFFFKQASCSHTLTIPHMQPQRQTRLTQSNHNFYLTQPIKLGTVHIHTNVPLASCCSQIPAKSCAELGGQAAVLMASAVTHGLPECVRLPDVPLAFPVEHSPRTHSTSPHWAPSFQNTVLTAHIVLAPNPLYHAYNQLGN